MKESCLLWTKAKDLAQERGFEMSRFCPVDSLCTGEKCTYIDPEPIKSETLGKFYRRLEAHERKVNNNEENLEVEKESLEKDC